MAKKKATRKTKRKTKSTLRADSMENLATGIGGLNDRRRQTNPMAARILTHGMLTNLYRNGGLPRRIVDLLPGDALRNWFRITNDKDDKVKQRLEELKAQHKLTRGWKMARLYGGGLVVMLINDGQDTTEPVKEKRIRSVEGLTVFDKREIHVQSTDINTDPTSGDFLEPMMYQIQPSLGGAHFRVHASRVIRFDGDELGWREYQGHGYWHDSVLQTVWEPIRQFAAVLDSSEFIIEQFVINTLKIHGLMNHIATKDGRTLLKERLQLLDKAMHTANHALLDSSEEYAKTTASVAGLPDLVSQFMMNLGAGTGYPLTLLFGRSPAGENATGESDIRLYYDRVKSEQETSLRPKLEPLIRYIFRSNGFKEPKAWTIKWNPLRQMSEAEIAELYSKTAEGDQLYIMNSVLSPEAIAKHRFVGDEFNTTPPSISEEEFAKEEKEQEEAAQRELEEMRAKAEAAKQQADQPPGAAPTPPDGQAPPNQNRNAAD